MIKEVRDMQIANVSNKRGMGTVEIKSIYIHALLIYVDIPLITIILI